MLLRGKHIDPVQFWSTYCDDVKPGPGPFLDLVFCPNPGHLNTRTPAFQINISKPFVHCFSHCGVSGVYEHAVCVIEGLYDKLGVTEDDIKRAKIKWQPGEPKEISNSRRKVRRAWNAARKIIFQRASVLGRSNAKRATKVQVNVKGAANRTKGDITRANAVAVKSKTKVVSEDILADYTYLPRNAQKYLAERGIDESSRHRWEIGFDESAERVTIPVRDHRGRLLFIIRRGIYKWQKPAYLYPPDSPKKLLLFGLDRCDQAMLRLQGLILVEGPFDCIRLHQHGYKNTVAILGDHISKEQQKLISRQRPKRIVLFFDKDQGGVWAMQSAAPLTKKYQVKVVRYPKGEALDPAKLSSEQIEKALRKAVPFHSVSNKLKAIKREGAIA